MRFLHLAIVGLFVGCGGGDADTSGNAPVGVADDCEWHCSRPGNGCECTQRCEADRYEFTCDGESCECVHNGSSLGSFAMAASCDSLSDAQLEATPNAACGFPQ